MFLIYVDESGDPGPYTGNNSQHYILSGIVIPADRWNDTFERMKGFKRGLVGKYGLPYREEIHASELIRITKNKSYRAIKKSNRVSILRDFVQAIPSVFADSKIINICLHKEKVRLNQETYQALAWQRLIQRYENYLGFNKRGYGLFVADMTDEPTLRKTLRKMRVYNNIPNRDRPYGYSNKPIRRVIEDPIMRDSTHALFVQAADTVCHCLYRREYPKGSLRKFGVERLFDRLEPLLYKQASTSDEMGIVRK